MTTDMLRAVKRCSKPETVALLVVRDAAHNRSNIMPLGWKMWTSGKPRMIAFSIAQEHYSHDLLLAEKECVLTWPGKNMIQGLLDCGSVSGRLTDKLLLTGWETAPAAKVGAPLLAGGIVNLECRVIEAIPTGDHTLFICSLEEGYVTEKEGRVLFTLNDEAYFSHAGQGKGYRFGTFT
ncbi:MAG TPA: flavin reductase family protein [Spirochaetia bacterium]|nr:flavin reductase family protein [Spirochaetia bacterium]